MKFFIAFALIATVASAAVNRPTQLSAEDAQIAEIVAAIQSPSTDPATAAALEALLLDVMGVQPAPVGVESSPISVGPAFIDFPLPDGGNVNVVGAPAVNPSPVVQPSPVVIGEVPAGASPLVQIIVNVNGQEFVIAPAPVDSAVVDEVYVPGPVNVVDNFFPETVVNPIQVVNPVVVEPVQVVSPVVVPGPVNIVESAPVVLEPIQVVSPVVVPGPVNIVESAPVVLEPIQVVSPVVVPGPVNIVESAPVVLEPIQVVSPVVVPGPVNIVDNVVVEPVVVGTPIIPAPVVVLPEELN